MSVMSPTTVSSRGCGCGRNLVEGPDLKATVEKFGDQVGADEAGAAGHEHPAEVGRHDASPITRE